MNLVRLRRREPPTLPSAAEPRLTNPGEDGHLGSKETAEGGGPSASESRLGRKGASPFPADILRPVAEGQGVAATRGPKPPEANGQSAGDQRDSAGHDDEPAISPCMILRPLSLRGAKRRSNLIHYKGRDCFGHKNGLAKTEKRYRKIPHGHLGKGEVRTDGRGPDGSFTG